MLQIRTKLTSQGQVSVPAAIRNFLNLAPGSVRHSTAEVHQALFGDAPAAATPAKTLTELKQGIRQHMQRRHAGR
jgi:antitoxin PrlF